MTKLYDGTIVEKLTTARDSIIDKNYASIDDMRSFVDAAEQLANPEEDALSLFVGHYEDTILNACIRTLDGIKENNPTSYELGRFEKLHNRVLAISNRNDAFVAEPQQLEATEESYGKHKGQDGRIRQRVTSTARAMTPIDEPSKNAEAFSRSAAEKTDREPSAFHTHSRTPSGRDRGYSR